MFNRIIDTYIKFSVIIYKIFNQKHYCYVLSLIALYIILNLIYIIFKNSKDIFQEKSK